jgi:hypothetical protein
MLRCEFGFTLVVNQSVLGICDILVQIQIHGSGPLTNRSESGSTFRMQKKYLYFFLLTYPQAHYLQSLIYCF